MGDNSSRWFLVAPSLKSGATNLPCMLSVRLFVDSKLTSSKIGTLEILADLTAYILPAFLLPRLTGKTT